MPIVKNTDTLKAAKAAYSSMGACPSASTQTDAQLFSSPNNLFGNALLSLAERYSDKTIAEKVNASGKGSQHVVTLGAIDQRVKAALKMRAKAERKQYSDVKAAHDQLRFAAGVKNATRTSRGKMNQQIQAAMKVSSSLSEETVAEGEEDGEEGGEEDRDDGDGEVDEDDGADEDEEDAFVDSSKAI